MQSLGNDFIVIYETAAISEIFNFKISQIRKMADRKKGIGADQILLVKKLDNSEEKFQYKIFNLSLIHISEPTRQAARAYGGVGLQK